MSDHAGASEHPGMPTVVDTSAAHRTLDFAQPVAVMMIAPMHLIVDADDPYGIVRSLLAAVSPGVVLVQQWRPGNEAEAAAHSTMWCGVARKP
jgi:hypothetical protein